MKHPIEWRIGGLNTDLVGQLVAYVQCGRREPWATCSNIEQRANVAEGLLSFLGSLLAGQIPMKGALFAAGKGLFAMHISSTNLNLMTRP